MTATTITVSNSTQLMNALKNATGGETILLEGGDYGKLTLSNTNFSAEVTLRAQDVGDPPSFDSVLLSSCRNFTFDGIEIAFVPTETTVEWDSGFRADSSTNISVLNSTITGGPAVAGIDPGLPAGSQGDQGIMGYPIGIGMNFLNCSGVLVENTEISEFSAGIRIPDTSDFVLRDSEIHDVRKVPLGGGNVDNVLLEGNYFHNIAPWNFSAAGDHGDFVHFWTRTVQTSSCSNITIRNNLFLQADGTGVLGINLNNDSSVFGFENVVIDNNVLHLSNAQGMRMERVNGLVITANTMLPTTEVPQDAPRILLTDTTRNVLIDNNIYGGVFGPALANMAGNAITIADNLAVQRHDPLAANYVGRLFVDALDASSEPGDFRPLPGSIAAGYGAVLTKGDFTHGTSPLYVTDSHSSGLAVGVHKFGLASFGDIPLPPDATVKWDFGDGGHAKGAKAVHSFTEAGYYTVTALITFADGDTQTLERTIRALSPVSLETDFEADANTGDFTGSVGLVNDELGRSIRLNSSGSTVDFGGDELLNNTEFTISFAFKKDVATASGYSLYYSGTATVNVGSNSISLSGKTDASETINLSASNIGVQDQEWHLVTYSFSQEKGTATLYVDGDQVAQVAGLTGRQYTTSGHELHLGNPFGSSLPALFDNLVFLRGALTSDQAAAQYQDFQSGIMTDYSPAAGTIAELEVLKMALDTGFVAYDGPTEIALKTPAAFDDEGLNLGHGVAAKIAREHVVDIVGAEGFRIDFDLKADSAASFGDVFRLSSTMIARITDRGELRIRAFTEEGEFTLQTKHARLDDTKSHHASIIFDDGVMNIAVDGVVRASAVVPDVLSSRSNSNFVFGHGIRDVFAGDMTSLDVTVTAPSVADASLFHDSFGFLANDNGMMPLV